METIEDKIDAQIQAANELAVAIERSNADLRQRIQTEAAIIGGLNAELDRLCASLDRLLGGSGRV